MSREAQKIVHQLRSEGLGDEEIVWYAVNMHDADEDEIRAELQPAGQESAAEGAAREQPVQPAPQAERPGTGGGGASVPQGNTGAGNAGRGEAVVAPSPHGTLADNGYWIALKAILLGSIVMSFSNQLFVVPGLSYRVEDQIDAVLYYMAFAGIVVWAILRQLEIALPGSRLAAGLRPVLYGGFVVASHYGVSAVMWPEWMPAPAFYVQMTLVGLLFLEVFTLLRRWIGPLGMLFFIALHIVMLNSIGWLGVTAFEVLYNDATMAGVFRESPPYVLSDVTATEKAIVLLQSVAEVLVFWALFAFCGRHRPGRTLSEWSAAAGRLVPRLLRGEFGLARSFWYFGVVGWLPLRVFSMYAEHVGSDSLLLAFGVANVVFWGIVAYVLWQAARRYAGPKVWPVLSGGYVLLGVLASAIPFAAS